MTTQTTGHHRSGSGNWSKTAILAWCSLCACVACAETPRPTVTSPSPEGIRVSGADLGLLNDGGGCALVTKAGTEALGIPWPCNFHRQEDGTIRSVSSDGSSIVLVESSRPDPDYSGDCITRIRAVRIENGAVEISTGTSSVATCPPFDWEQKMFLGLFE